MFVTLSFLQTASKLFFLMWSISLSFTLPVPARYRSFAGVTLSLSLSLSLTHVFAIRPKLEYIRCVAHFMFAQNKNRICANSPDLIWPVSKVNPFREQVTIFCFSGRGQRLCAFFSHQKQHTKIYPSCLVRSLLHHLLSISDIIRNFLYICLVCFFCVLVNSFLNSLSLSLSLSRLHRASV